MFVSNIQITQGHIHGTTCLPLPSTGMSRDGAADNDDGADRGNDNPERFLQIHALEGALITWTKQIKNAVFVKTTDFARPPELSPCPTHGHHWYANAESYFLIGEACGEGMKSLLK